MTAPPRISRRTAILCCALANIIGASTYVVMLKASQGLPDLTISWLRVFLSVSLFAVVCAKTGQLVQRFTRHDHCLLFLVGVPGFAAPVVLGLLGVQWSTPGHAAILILIEPVAIVPLSILFLGERPSRARLLGVALGALGATVVITRGQGPSDILADGSMAGKLALAVQAVMWAVFTVAAKPLLHKYSSWTVGTWSLLYALLALTPLVILEIPALRPEFLDGLATSWGLRDLSLNEALWPSLLATAYLALAATFLGTLLWNLGLSGVSASAMAGFIFLQPLVGLALDAILYSNRPGTAELVGAGIIVGAVLLIIRPTPPFRLTKPKAS